MAHIKTYARLKPPKKPNENFFVSNNVLTIQVPDVKDSLQMAGSPLSRNSATYDVCFDGIFDPHKSQQDVFDSVANDIIQSFLTGFNGTIFAYGQTGTGKTYTVEGNSCRYQSRGLATRALSMIYEELEKRPDEHISVYLSFLEIYQEVAYDLLNPASRTMLPVLPFSKVTVVEGPNGSCILRGLSVHLAANEDVAQMLLLQGQANRRVAETTVNQRSSRSHAVFSVYLQSRKKDSQIILNSKLHLVDLAGSERVSKTGVDGQQLSEAKSINLSLHHLETVIIFLQAAGTDDHTPSQSKSPSVSNSRSSNSMVSYMSSDSFPLRRSRKHIPYRNSLLTMILKDSLGGNCLTAMIATLSLEPENICESLSTCRFAQRVARVANFAKRNEEIDDKMLIKKLKIKVAQLETRLALALAQADPSSSPGKHGRGLSPRDEVDCQQIIEEFLQGIIDDPVSAGISTQIRFRECLHLMKCRMLQNNVPTMKKIVINSSPSSTSPSALKRGNGVVKKQDNVHVTWAEVENKISPSVDGKESLVSPQSPVVASPKFYATKEPDFSKGDELETHHHPPDEWHHTQPQHQHHHHHHHPQQQQPLQKQQQQHNLVAPSQKLSTKDNHATSVVDIDEDIDDIDKLLLEATATSTSTSNGYKTPFERKREQKIKKLGKTLLTMEEKKAAQEEQLELMKQNTVLDSLRMEEDGLSLKLQVANEQVADQHAYILHLKHIESDPELLSQEALVEKQLQKRQEKFQAKLKDVQERRMGVERELNQMAEGKGKNQSDKKSSRSLEDRYGQFRQNKGSLNTRQVFEMLKNEEKKQKKDLVKVEREKTVVKTKQLELKEMATWEKLRELKQMLKMSQLHEQQQQQQQQSQGLSILSSGMEYPADDSNTLSNIKQLPLEGEEKSHSEFISDYIQSVQEKINNECHSTKNASTNHDKGSDQSWAVSLLQQDMHLSSVPSPLNNAPCSPVQSTSSNLIPHPSGKFAMGRDEQMHGKINDKKKDSNNNSSYDHSYVKNFHQKNEEKARQSDSSLFPTWSAYQLPIETSVDNDALRLDLNPGTPTAQKLDGFHSDLVGNPADHLGATPSLEGFMEMLAPSTVESLSTTNQSPLLTNHKLLPPSEYINSMTEQERFDARKMGLSSRTFESALSHMLDEQGKNREMHHNVPDLPYSVDVYENYTRKSSSSSRPYQSQSYYDKNRHRSTSHRSRKSSSFSNLLSDSSKSHSSYSQGGPRSKKVAKPSATEKLDKVLEESSTWGPNVKNVSIADRLNGLFDESVGDASTRHNGKYSQRNGTPSGENKEPSMTIQNGLLDSEDLKDDDGYDEEEEGERVGGVVIDRSCSEDDLFFGQHTPRTAITAVKKEEGEKTFMSRVASERERIAKIRKARHAAEVIQKHWRKFKS